jgi:excisionase family DNA binding protein
MIRATALPDVLTLEETASYLRMPTETIERVATRGQLPGRRIEDSWRFLREAIDEWLRSSDSRTVLLQQAGALSDDDMTADLLSSVYQLRGRPEKDTDA